MKNVSLCAFLSLILMLHTQIAQADVPSIILRDVGSYNVPNGNCSFAIKNSAHGDFKQISFPIGNGKTNDIDDVTSAAFLSDKLLVFAISPTFGYPGIFTYSCGSKVIARIVSPHNVTLAYKRGADYYLLQSVNQSTIYYYYASNIDEINFVNFEEPENLYEVRDNGALLKKSTAIH